MVNAVIILVLSCTTDIVGMMLTTKHGQLVWSTEPQLPDAQSKTFRGFAGGTFQVGVDFWPMPTNFWPMPSNPIFAAWEILQASMEFCKALGGLLQMSQSFRFGISVLRLGS